MALGSILQAAIGIGLLIFLHELGHFLAARAAGVRVEVFSLGFGPRLTGFRWRGTDFRLSAVPFGGFVMVAGQDPNDRRYPPEVSLHSKSVAQRALFWSGGVIMNLLFALIVFPIVFGAGVKFEAPIAGPIARGSAAWEAGIERGERIVEVAGKRVYSWQNLLMEVALNGNRPVDLLVEGTDGARRVVTARPQYDAENGMYELGLTPAFDADNVVLTVPGDGPAKAAGLQTGDRVLQINDASPLEVGAIDEFDAVTVRVRRGDEELERTVQPKATTEGVSALIGVRPLSNRVQGIRPGSALVERLGLRHDDRVLAIDGRPFLSGELADFATGPGDTAWLVQRGDEVVPLSADGAGEGARAELIEHVALAADLRLQVQPSPGGAAEDAGLRDGDWIRAIDGRPLGSWDDLRDTVVAAGEKPLTFSLLRPDAARVVDGLQRANGSELELTITPRKDAAPDFGWQIAFARRMVLIQADSFGDAVSLGTVCSIDLVKQLYVTMKRLLTGEVGAKNLGGIIRISQVSYHAAQRGPSWFWYFLALLSVNLAFVNLLPIPVLDGGHLMFLLIEKVKGSPVSTRVFGYSQVIGLVFVLLLVLFVTYNDILRLL